MNIIEQDRTARYYRQAFADMPVGGPMDGAAYGEYLKSKGLGKVIGVVAAVAAVVTGGATLAAWATASAAQLISAGAMVAGGVMSGVGAVTGNQKLTKIGGVLSLAGGLGGAAFGTAFSKGLVSGVNAAGEGAAAAAAGSTATTGLDAAAADAGKAAAEAGGKVATDSTSATLNLSDKFGAALGDTTSAFGPDKAGGILKGETVASMAAEAGTPAQVSGGSVAQMGADAAAVPGGGKSLGTLPLATNASAGGATSYLDKGMDIIGGVGKFAKENKELVEIAGKTLQGIGAEGPQGNRDLQAANANAANATADATRQAMDLKAQQAANANAQVIVLDPRDPNYAQKKAAAEAAGRKTVDLTGAAQNGPVTMAGVDYGANANQWQQNRLPIAAPTRA